MTCSCASGNLSCSHWPAASGAHAVRLIGRLEAFHAVALDADRPFAFDAGVLRAAG